jgi:uncharacterized protein
MKRSEMKIILVDYKEGVPVSVEETYDPKKLDIEFVDLKYTKPLQMTGVVEKASDTITFSGTLKSRIEKLCGRCLKQLSAPLEKDFVLYYETAGKDVIDTIDDLRETLILDHSLAYVCSAACKGLCPHCGGDRNEKNCRCEIKVKNNAFGELKKLLKKKKD